jgi:iron complex transport system substrate-binding protein
MLLQRRMIIGTMILILAALVSACAQATPEPQATAPEPTAGPVELIDGLGREITLSQPAQRVVSLAPSNTEILFFIGAGGQVVGRDAFSDYPAEAASIPDVGGGFGEYDVEKIVSLKPDLLLASQLMPAEQVKALEDLGLKVYYLSNPTDLEGMFENLRLVAKLTGRTAGLEEKIQGLEARIQAVQEKLVDLPERVSVFYELDATDPNAPWTAGKGTFVSNLIAMAGGDNLGDQLEGEWVQLSIEKLVEQNPDIILLGDAVWGGITVESVAARSGWGDLRAVKESRVYPFDDNLASRPGPRMVDGLETLAKLLYPERFEE